MIGQLDFFDILTPEKPKSKVDLYNADCLDILKTIPDESIDLVVTDCPYHIVSGGCTNDAVKIAATRECGGMLQKRRKDAHGNIFYGDNNHISLVGFLDDNRNLYTKQGKIFKHNDIEFDEWLPEIYRILKPDTHCYIMINPRNVKELQQQAENVGFIFQNILIWDKGNLTPNKYYMQAYEMILMLRKGRAKNINNMGSSNILRIPNVIGKKAHPTEKPADLMQVLIENSTEPGQTVIDPFMGVGGGRCCVRKVRKTLYRDRDRRGILCYRKGTYRKGLLMKVLLGMPSVGMIPAKTVISLLQTVERGKVEPVIVTGSLIYDSRDQIATYAVNEGYDYVLYADSDMVFSAGDLKMLLAHNTDIVSGLYVTRKGEKKNVAYTEVHKRVNEPFKAPVLVHDTLDTGYGKIAAVGFGFCLIRTEVLKTMFKRYKSLFEPKWGVGEDIAFCIRAKRCGYQVFVDRDVKLGHIGEKVYE